VRRRRLGLVALQELMEPLFRGPRRFRMIMPFQLVQHRPRGGLLTKHRDKLVSRQIEERNVTVRRDPERRDPHAQKIIARARRLADRKVTGREKIRHRDPVDGIAQAFDGVARLVGM